MLMIVKLNFDHLD